MLFYVYRHIRLSNDKIFYIGKGTGNRLYDSHGRNKRWKYIVRCDGGYVAEIVKDNLSEHEAFELEIKLIAEIGLSKLVNCTGGGTGGNTRIKYSDDRYREFIQRKSKAQTGKVGYWRGKCRNDMVWKIKNKHASGSYTYSWFKFSKSELHKHRISEAARKRIRLLVNCDKCGKQLPDTHVARHKVSKQCINKLKF